MHRRPLLDRSAKMRLKALVWNVATSVSEHAPRRDTSE